MTTSSCFGLHSSCVDDRPDLAEYVELTRLNSDFLPDFADSDSQTSSHCLRPIIYDSLDTIMYREYCSQRTLGSADDVRLMIFGEVKQFRLLRDPHFSKYPRFHCPLRCGLNSLLSLRV